MNNSQNTSTLPKEKKNTFRGLISKFSDELFDNTLRWFLAEIAYTILPIGVIIAIKFWITGKLDILYLSPEWSFATIVFYGISITKLIKLKMEIQEDRSHRVYSGTRLSVLLLITSAMVLALVSVKDTIIISNKSALWQTQISLFSLSIITLFVANLKKSEFYSYKSKLPNNLPRWKYYRYILRSLYKIDEELIYLQFAMRKSQKINHNYNKDNIDSLEILDQEVNRDILAILERIKQNLEKSSPSLSTLTTQKQEIQ